MPLSFDQLLNLDIEFPAIAFGTETWAIESYLNVLEDEIAHARDQYRLRKLHELKKISSDIDDVEHRDRWAQIDKAADEQLPRFFRIGAVVAIWGFFESFIQDIARYVQKRENALLKLRDIHGTDELDQASKYFKGILRIDLAWSDRERMDMEHLRQVRNILAHNNGRLEDAPAEQVNRATKLIKNLRGIRIADDTLVIDALYVQDAWQLVHDLLDRLLQQLADRYCSNSA